jgi:hypothetical protein
MSHVLRRPSSGKRGPFPGKALLKQADKLGMERKNILAATL